MVRVHPTGTVTVYTGTSPPRPGPRHELCADRRRPARRRSPAGRGDPRRHRPGARGSGHVRLAVARRRRRGASPAARRRSRRRPSGSAPRSWRPRPEDVELVDGKYQSAGSPDKFKTLAEIAGAAHIPPQELPDRIELGLEETHILRPGELRLPVRRARVRGRRRRRDGQGRGRALRRRRRLRPGDQPDADRRPDPRRDRPRDRAGAVRADRLRRGRPAGHRHVRGLRAPDGRRAAELRDRPYRDPVAGQLARRQGHRRGRHDRRHTGRDRGRARRARRRSACSRSDMPLTPRRVWEAIESQGGVPA